FRLPTMLFVSAATISLDWTVKWLNGTQPTDLFSRSMIGINDAWPIPPIVGTLGDILEIKLTNQLEHPTSLHFHGFFQNNTNFMDGAIGVTQCGIQPGQTYLYRVNLAQTGSYWVHGHHFGDYPDGFRTPLIVKNPDEPYKYDDEYIVGLSDWYQQEYGDLFTNLFAIPDNTDGLEPAPNTPLIGDKQYNMYQFTAGKTYRFRFVNMATFSTVNVWFEGHNMTIIEVDGVTVQPLEVPIIPVHSAQRYSVLVTAKDTFNYKLHADLPDFGNAPEIFRQGVTADLIQDPALPFFENAVVPDPDLFDDLQLHPYEPLAAGVPDVYFRYDITSNYYDDDLNHAAFNYTVYQYPNVLPLLSALSTGENATNPATYGPWTNSIVLPHNKIIEIAIVNRDREGDHPIHLHGHSFQIVGRGKQGGFDIDKLRPTFNALENPVRRDVVFIPLRGWAVIRFRSDNPGAWFLHCHMSWHFNAGLAAQIIEAPEILQQRLQVSPQARDQCLAQGVNVIGNAAGYFDTETFTGLKP
ncbi:Cupredoxin, partial [Gorgonomyces haynaldii]